jgi:hypothetical protein
MWREEHEARCIEFFGKPYTEVHQWLDALYVKLGYKHRTVRHTPEGIEQIVQMFGESARCPALLHLYDDYEYYNYYNQDGNIIKSVRDLLYED